jgi:regulator of replication initiation timing
MDKRTLPLPELLGTSLTSAAMLSLAEQCDALRQQYLSMLEENAALRAGKAALEAWVAGYRASRT